MRQQKTQSPKGLGHNLKVANTAGNIISFRRGKLGVPKEYPQTNWHHLHFCNTSSALAKALAHTEWWEGTTLFQYSWQEPKDLSPSLNFKELSTDSFCSIVLGLGEEEKRDGSAALALERLISTIEEIEILGHSPKRVNISVEKISFHILNPSRMSLF